MPRRRRSELFGRILLTVFGLTAGLLCAELGLRLAGTLIRLPQVLTNRRTASDASAYRILVLGESTTAGTRNWPYYLERILNERSRKRAYKVFNAAVPGVTTPYLLAGIERKLDAFDPHLVIAMMGINDDYSRVVWEGGGGRAPLWRRLRLYKLLHYAWKGLRKEHGEKRASTINDGMHDDDWRRVREGQRICMEERGFSRAEKIFQNAFEENPNAKILDMWGDCRKEAGEISEAEALYQRAAAAAPGFAEFQVKLAYFYLGRNRLAEAERGLKEALRIEPDLLPAYTLMAEVQLRQGRTAREVETFLKRNLLYLKVGARLGGREVTRYHYKMLNRALRARGIRLIAMQYPNKSAEEFKELLGDAPGVVLLNNERNFAKALADGRYEDYFMDRFAATFGHCTPKGNRLIAENAAVAVLRLAEGAPPPAKVDIF